MLASFFTRKLRKTPRTAEDGWLFAARLGKQVVGFASYLHENVVLADLGMVTICWLYYIALAPEFRNVGYGRFLYDWIIDRASSEACVAVFFEVERPDHSPDARLAERRLEWYRRNGAKKLSGIRYFQSVGWQPRLEMDILIHALKPLNEQQAYELAEALVGDALEQVEPIALK